MDPVKELKEKLIITGGSIDTIPTDKEKLEAWAGRLSLEAHAMLMERLRSARDFYKRIMLEERRAKNPNSYRYEDAEKHIVRYNAQGKALKELFNTRQNNN